MYMNVYSNDRFNNIPLTAEQFDVVDFIAFESECAIVYPFAVKFDNVTFEMVNNIIKGCNGYTNIFLVIITAWHIIQYMNKKEKREKMFVICLLSLMIAAMAELKAFFLEFMVVVLLAVAITKFSTRKLWIILISILVVVVGLRAFELIFPYFNQWRSVAKRQTCSCY